MPSSVASRCSRTKSAGRSSRFACRLSRSIAPCGARAARVGLVVAAVLLTCGSRLPAADEVDSRFAEYYGFKPLELVKLERRSQNLVAGDVDGDGLTDLVLVDNGHSRIDLLVQRKTPAPDAKPAATEKDVNALTVSGRFEHVKVPVDQAIASLALGDFDGDRKTDIAYFGEPDKLVVLRRNDRGDWGAHATVRLADVEPRSWILAAGDLDGDSRDDLVVLGKTNTYVVLQTADGRLAPPRTLLNTSEKGGLAHIADVDGDGRNDLCYVVEDATRALRIRFQRKDGQLGPESAFETKRPRALTLADTDGRPGKEIVSIDAQTGRVRIHGVERPQVKPGELAGRLVQFGLGSASAGRDRDLATGDLDGDGRTDVVVTDPETAQVLVFRQHGDQGLDLGTTFPGLVGAVQVRCADLDRDGRDEVVVLSPKEGTVGVSKLTEGRLEFPKALPIVDEPAAIEVADLTGDDRADVAYVSRNRQGGGSKYALRGLAWADGGWVPAKFGKDESVLLDLKGTPERLVRLDADGDGRSDFLVFSGVDRAPQLFSTRADGTIAETVPEGGLKLGEISSGAVFVGGPQRDVLLVAQDNFARRMRLQPDRRWQVTEQYNATESNARVAGAASLDLDGRPGDEVVLVDSGASKLRVLRREEQVYRQWREIDLGTFPFKSVRTADLDGDGRTDLLLFGRSQFAVLYAGRTDPALVERGTFETRLDKASLSDVLAGDVNDDGVPDLVALDVQSHRLEIVDVDRKAGPRHATSFRLFEEKSFSSSEGGGTEPREGVLADVTGDGLPDIVLLAHDRVLVLPQDRGRR